MSNLRTRAQQAQAGIDSVVARLARVLEISWDKIALVFRPVAVPLLSTGSPTASST